MLLNPFERRLVSGSLRRSVLRHWDIPRFLRLGGGLQGRRVLEVGCGRGYGIEAAYGLLGADVVHAFDPDPAMVSLARQSMTRAGDFKRTPPAKLWQGEAMRIPAPDADYDAVLCLQVLHHIEDWRAAVGEITRVLRPGGKLLLADSLVGFLQHPLFGRWMDHPSSDRFDRTTLLQELERQGFRILGCKGRGRWMVWLVAEFVGGNGSAQSARIQSGRKGAFSGWARTSSKTAIIAALSLGRVPARAR